MLQYNNTLSKDLNVLYAGELEVILDSFCFWETVGFISLINRIQDRSSFAGWMTSHSTTMGKELHSYTILDI